jgi:hypothetical protein
VPGVFPERSSKDKQLSKEVEMIFICLTHNMIDKGSGWENSSHEDVTEEARTLRKPTCVTSCPVCNGKEVLKKNFLSDQRMIRQHKLIGNYDENAIDNTGGA